jgi:ankyrin repeat protein
MNSFFKLSSIKNDSNCNCIKPFYLNDITGYNPNTGRDYSNEDKDIIKTSLYRISNARGCTANVCCDPNDPTSSPDPEFVKNFVEKFPKIMPIYDSNYRSKLTSIKLSTNPDVSGRGWVTPSTYMICKLTKAKIVDTEDSTIKNATNLVTDCFTDNCNQAESITVNNLIQNSKVDMKYTYFDDARVTQAIRESNITYLKTYIYKYKQIDMPLTNDDYNNRLIHIASESPSLDILNMMIALRAKLNITNKLNETPIHFAVRSKRIDNIDALLNQGVDLTIANKNGETPIFYAMQTGDLRIIKMLYNNNSPIITLDKDGNNLIQYCILNCPSYKEDDDTVLNTKSEIITFLINHGLHTGHKNKKGLTSLELVSKGINEEINKESAIKKDKTDSDIIEKFFDVKSNNINNKPNNNKSKEHFNSGGAFKQNTDISEYTTEHLSLLEIQSSLFNNIIKNNPDKYNKYISVDELPKGSPIEILDTVCVGDGMTGNEDSDECVKKGGQLIKIKNKTTKIKLELTPDSEIAIDKISQSDLYFKKENEKIPVGTMPANVKQYNNSIVESSNTNEPQSIPQTAGITYNIGEATSNIFDKIGIDLGFDPKPTNAENVNNSNSNSINKSLEKESSDSSSQNKNKEVAPPPDHPPMFDESDDIVNKYKTDAINNSIKITTANTIPQTNQGFLDFIIKYKVFFIVLFIFIILVLIVVIVYNNYSKGNGKNN